MSMQIDPALKCMQVDGVRLAYREAGFPDHEPVVLVHGYPANQRSWRHQIPVLGQSHRVKAVDLIGWGNSERPRSLAFDYDTEGDRLGRVLDALGLAQVNLFGHDYGAWRSSTRARREPLSRAGTRLSHWWVFWAARRVCARWRRGCRWAR